MSKLPNSFKQEIVRKTGKNYPSMIDSYENYVDIISTLDLKAPNEYGKMPSTTGKSVVASGIGEQRKVCKFCSDGGHSMFRCRK